MNDWRIWNQLKYIVFGCIALFFHYIFVNVLFGTIGLLDVPTMIYMGYEFVFLTIAFPVFVVIMAMFQNRFQVIIDGQTMLKYMLFGIPIAILLYIGSIVIGRIYGSIILAINAGKYIVYPFATLFAYKWNYK